MSLSPEMEGLSLDQAPPLSIPMSFFVTAPLFLVIAGLVLLVNGSAVLTTPLLPITFGLAHLGTLGFLGVVMMGALYQMTPVVAVAPVRAIRLAHVVHFFLATGILMLVLWSHQLIPPGMAHSVFGSIGLAVLVLAFTVGVALAKSKTNSPSVAGMRFAVACLVIVMLLGNWMSTSWYTTNFPGHRSYYVQVHFTIAILGWVGGLLTAVAWQTLPMFYMTPEVSKTKAWSLFALIVVGVSGALLVMIFSVFGFLENAGSELAAIAALPAAFAVWIWHPKIVLTSLANRRRSRVDPSIKFWRVGMLMALPTFVCAGLAVFVTHQTWGPRFDLLFGWCAIFGWAGLIVHGMLTRIGPFLIWFHRFSPHIGRIPVPAMRRMIPDKLIEAGWKLHVLTLALGGGAILTPMDGHFRTWLARSTGLLLLATGAVIATYFKVLLGLKPELK